MGIVFGIVMLLLTFSPPYALPARDQAAIVEFLKCLQVLPEGSIRVAAENAIVRLSAASATR